MVIAESGSIESLRLSMILPRLIYNLAYPDKRVVGVYSQLPIIGKSKNDPSWTIINALKEFVEVENLNNDIDELDQNIDVLMLVHPKKLDNKTLYAIDQYLLRGGKAIIFIHRRPVCQATKQIHRCMGMRVYQAGN